MHIGTRPDDLNATSSSTTIQLTWRIPEQLKYYPAIIFYIVQYQHGHSVQYLKFPKSGPFSETIKVTTESEISPGELGDIGLINKYLVCIFLVHLQLQIL